MHSKIRQKIKQASSKFGHGSNQISKIILKNIHSEIFDWLKTFFNTYLMLGYFSNHFRHSMTLVLQKPCNSIWDYPQLKIHRLITLVNIAWKAPKTILASQISFLSTKYNLLFLTHLGKTIWVKLRKCPPQFLRKNIFKIEEEKSIYQVIKIYLGLLTISNMNILFTTLRNKKWTFGLLVEHNLFFQVAQL